MTTQGPRPSKVVPLIAGALDAARIELQPIEPVPLLVPLERAAALWLLPWSLEPESRAGLLHTPAGKKTKALYATPGDTRAALQIVRELGSALGAAGEGTLELMSVSIAEFNSFAAADDDEDDDEDDEDEDGGSVPADPAAEAQALALREAARFRLRGTVQGRHWLLTHAWPRVSTDQLRGAFEILDRVDGESDEWARDEAEARAVEAMAARSISFIRTNPAQVKVNALAVQGAKITVTQERRAALAMMLLRHRLGDGPWALRVLQRRDEEWLAQHLEGARRSAELLAKRLEQFHAPRLATLLETRAATYFQTDLARTLFTLPEVPNVVPLLALRIDGLHYKDELPYLEALPKVDAQLDKLGFAKLGDYQHSQQPRHHAFRVYGGAGGSVALFGILAGSFAMHWMFYTLLGADFWVCTATFDVPSGAPRPPRSSHRAVGKIMLADQLAEHRRHVAAHAKEGAAHPSPKTLMEALQLMDLFNAAVRP